MGLKYFMGWMSSKTMLESNWKDVWQRFVTESETRNMQVVVFEIPADNSELINKIAKLIETETQIGA